MKIFKKISDYLSYQCDSLKVNFVFIKIEKFSYAMLENKIMVIYTVGRKRLTQRMDIYRFETEFFGRISTYDKCRLTQFVTLQTIYDDLLKADSCRQKDYINYIKTKIKNDPLF